MNWTKIVLIVGASLMALGVILGAFGAHALKDRITPELLQVYKTGVDYHFYHALGLLLMGAVSLFVPAVKNFYPSLFLMMGILLFSGSLYTMAFTGIKWLGAITPLGGTSFIVGWVLWLIQLIKSL